MEELDEAVEARDISLLVLEAALRDLQRAFERERE